MQSVVHVRLTIPTEFTLHIDLQNSINMFLNRQEDGLLLERIIVANAFQKVQYKIFFRHTIHQCECSTSRSLASRHRMSNRRHTHTYNITHAQNLYTFHIMQCAPPAAIEMGYANNERKVCVRSALTLETNMRCGRQQTG